MNNIQKVQERLDSVDKHIQSAAEQMCISISNHRVGGLLSGKTPDLLAILDGLEKIYQSQTAG